MWKKKKDPQRPDYPFFDCHKPYKYDPVILFSVIGVVLVFVILLALIFKKIL